MKFYEADGRPFEALLKPPDARWKLSEGFLKARSRARERDRKCVNRPHPAAPVAEGSGPRSRWGTRIAAPPTEPYVRLSRIGLLPRVSDSEAGPGPGVKDSGHGEKLARQVVHPVPFLAVLLTAPLQNAGGDLAAGERRAPASILAQILERAAVDAVTDQDLPFS
jgi:hypothetical protein